MHDHSQAGSSVQELLFDDLQGAQGSRKHAFKQGMASDMLSQGKPISLILAWGGWKSAAFPNITATDLGSAAALEQAFGVYDGEED